MKRKVNLQSDLAEKDPLMNLGYGIVAYRNMLWVLICAFSIFTVIAIPQLLIFRSGQGYKYGIDAISGKEHLSLGAMGYSSMQCS